MNIRTLLLLAAVFWLFTAEAKPDKSIKAVLDLIERVTPGYSRQFKLEIIEGETNSDVFEVDGNGKKIVLRGSTPWLWRQHTTGILSIHATPMCHGSATS